MTETDLPRLLRHLETRIPDADFRSYALEALMKRDWKTWTYDGCVGFCLTIAWRRRGYHLQRVVQWGGRARTRRMPAPNAQRTPRGKRPWGAADTLTPLRRVELMETLGVL